VVQDFLHQLHDVSILKPPNKPRKPWGTTHHAYPD
jgi:hypothetical protein